MHQLLRSASKLHVGVGFLPEKLPLRPETCKNHTIFRSDMQEISRHIPYCTILGSESIPCQGHIGSNGLTTANSPIVEATSLIPSLILKMKKRRFLRSGFYDNALRLIGYNPRQDGLSVLT